ncbi:uncharacterized protein [Henckelia pumila]|uniref:uncharacterized protein n=1 Tax=Henckelia pumila TaxID=405737 RepID=UPI003C6DDFA2
MIYLMSETNRDPFVTIFNQYDRDINSRNISRSSFLEKRIYGNTTIGDHPKKKKNFIMSSKIVTLFLLFLKICLFPTTSALNQEGVALLSWLSTFNNSSPSSSSFTSWKSDDQNPCKWDYIKCNSEGFVNEITITSVDLPTKFPAQVLGFNFLEVLVISYGNLSGEIPVSVGNLSCLITLDLSSNNLTGGIPGEIGSLSNLRRLSLNSNFLQGEIPKDIGNCTQLQQLELFDNMLGGRIPAEIGRLVFLEIFRTGGNKGINGEIPGELSNCARLSFLGLADTGITGQIPPTFGALKDLKTISIYTANLTGGIPLELSNCSSLENLFIYENQISGEVPEELGYLKNLRKLLLWQNNLRGTIPDSLGNCSSLMMLDLSLNFLTGEIPSSLQYIESLEELLLSDNNITGVIPNFIGNFSNLKQLELDNNNLSGEIPSQIGELKELTLFFAWQNKLQGEIPKELANCQKLQALDLSHNSLTGEVPKSLFNLKNLTKLLLLSNQLLGQIPHDIGNCTSLTRLRFGSNMFHGEIPSEIGMLESLSFLELSENQFSGKIPQEIGNCKELEMVDLHGNKLQGMIPLSFVRLFKLNVLDISMNHISGTIPENTGDLVSLNKLVLSGNNISGSIPESLGLCRDLQFLDLSSNKLSGSIPDEIGHLQELDILLNLSLNSLTGPLPESFSKFSKLSNMDLSHNMLVGSLQVISNLDNLVSLNVSYNNFSGSLPNTKFFKELPYSTFFGNQELCFPGNNKCHASEHHQNKKIVKNLTLVIVLIVITILIILTTGTMLFKIARNSIFKAYNDEENTLMWRFTPFQKLNFSIEDVVTRLSDSNIVGRGGSGIVYRVETPMRQVIAVKKLWPKKRGEISQRDLFSAEVATLGSVRHKNILRLLGCCDNGKTRLLLFDYISNGSLAGLLHEKKTSLDWNSRYNIMMGAAQGLAYLHHDCIPPIVHRDIKTNNILVGPLFEAFLADFGLAKLVNSSETSRYSNMIAGSYGYIAPEYGYSLKITEKSDVYSYGVVLLEVLTGMEPNDPRIPDGKHIVSWVYEELRQKPRDFTSILDQQLLLQSSTQTEEMVQVIGIALLCLNPCPDERPTMRDVTAMLEGCKHEHQELDKPTNSFRKEMALNTRSAVYCSSFRSSKSLIRSPLHSL